MNLNGFCFGNSRNFWHNIRPFGIDNSERAPDIAEFTLDSSEFAPDSSESTHDTLETAPDIAERTPDSSEFTLDSSEFAPDSSESTHDTSETASDIAERTPDSSEFAPDIREHTHDSTEFIHDTPAHSLRLTINKPPKLPFIYRMKLISYLLLLSLILSSSCKTTKPDVKHPEKNGALILSMERTPCFGRCPVYDIKLYENGLLIYNAQKFTDTTGCFYRVLTKQELSVLKDKFNNSGFFKMASQYPEDKKTPTDLPSCILFFNNGTAQKTVTDKRWETPETLTALEKTVDSLVNSKILQFCDK